MQNSDISELMGILNPVLPILDEIVRNGYATYREYPTEVLVEHSARTQANCIYDHVYHESLRMLDDVNGMRLIENKTLNLWCYLDEVIFRFKKMDEDGNTANYPTAQAESFDLQKPIDGIPQKPERISIGYFQNATNTGVERVQVAKPIGRRKTLWCAAILDPESRVGTEKIWEDVTRQQALAAG